MDQALKAKYGKACEDWRAGKRSSISPNGKPETKSPECGGIKYWFHSGNEFTTQADWTEYDNKIKEQACIKDRSDALSNKKSGKYTYGPTPGPDPCGKLVWLCNGAEYNSESDYKATTCGAPPPPKKQVQPKQTVKEKKNCDYQVVQYVCPFLPPTDAYCSACR